MNTEGLVDNGIDDSGRYQILNEIGRGSFAPVYRAWDEIDKKFVAIKLFNLEDVDDSIDDIHQEIAIMKELNRTRPQLVTYLSSYVVESSLWIIMEYLEGGSVSDILKQYGPLNEECCAYILKELLTALEFVHAELKIHRDVKAGNMLVGSDGCIKLADFGVTGRLKDNTDKRTTKIGTPFWMAPEVIMESGYDGCADIWSTGITAIELATGFPPYAKNWSSSVNPLRVIFEIPKNPPPRLEGDAFSPKFKDFVACCLQKDPNSRPTAKVLLQHDFMNSCTGMPAVWLERVTSMIDIMRFLRESEQESYNNRSGLLSSSSDSGEWDYSHSVSGTGRPGLRRGVSLNLSMGPSGYQNSMGPNSFDDVGDAGGGAGGSAPVTTMPRLRRSQSTGAPTNAEEAARINSYYNINHSNGSMADSMTGTRPVPVRGISRHRSLGVPGNNLRMYQGAADLLLNKPQSIDSSIGGPGKKPVRGIHRSQSTGAGEYMYSSSSTHRRMDLIRSSSKQPFSGPNSGHSSGHSGAASTSPTVSATAEAPASSSNKLVLDALSNDDSDSENGGSVGGSGSSSDNNSVTSPEKSTSARSRPPLPRMASMTSPPTGASAPSSTDNTVPKLKQSFSFNKSSTASAHVSTDDFDDGSLIVSGDACLVDSFDEEDGTRRTSNKTPTSTAGSAADNKGGTPNITPPNSTQSSPRTGSSGIASDSVKHNVGPFNTVLKILADAHLNMSETLNCVEDAAADNQQYSPLFLEVVKPSMQYLRDMAMADFNNEMMKIERECEEKEKLKALLGKMPSQDNRTNQRLQTALNSKDALEKRKAECCAEKEKISDVITVLIAAMVALDVRSQGEFTNTFISGLLEYYGEDNAEEEDEQDH